MTKKLDETTIMNELHGSSAFFRNAAARTPEPVNGRTPEHPHTSTPERADTRLGERANGRTPERTNRRTGERQIVRHSFNFYHDQIVMLKRLVAQRSLDGEEISLSDLARQAIDDFLAKQN